MMSKISGPAACQENVEGKKEKRVRRKLGDLMAFGPFAGAEGGQALGV